MDIGEWLRRLGLPQYEQIFRDNALDQENLIDLTEADLEKLGVLLGHRKTMLRTIAALGAPQVLENREISPTTGQGGERRQLTIMFCDLVGSTALSTQLDPEDLRDLITQYHECCRQHVARFGGYIAKYLGDGVLAYFGYPQAHEDDPIRAIHSGLAIIDGISELPAFFGLRHQVRIGIATGMVIVGDLIGEGAARESNVVGETPNLAARLQSVADPNALLISETTHALAHRFFKYREVGAIDLKGFPEPVRAWQVLDSSEIEGRFHAYHEGELLPLIGRTEELHLLRRRWNLAGNGEGGVVLLTGEPGIGKSRLAVELEQSISSERHCLLRFSCSPHHTDGTLYPFIKQLERAAEFDRNDSGHEKVEKLRTYLGQFQETRVTLAALVELLQLPCADLSAEISPDYRRKRRMVLAAFLKQIEGLSRRDPTLILIEDVQWADAASLELIDLLVERVRSFSALLVITFRPEFKAPWIGDAHITALTLARLGPRDILTLVSRVTGGKTLPSDVLHPIVERTDGIPLFVEELTRSLLESGFLVEQQDEYVLRDPLPLRAIPSSLQALLMARLDRLGPAKEVAQVGAALGREFSYEALAAIVRSNETQLQEALNSLSESGLLIGRGVAPHSTLTFKHALVQEAAYSTLLRNQRQELHGRIASVFAEQFPDIEEEEPGLLAHHFNEAGLIKEAIEYWRKAGDLALRRSANVEALIHLTRARESLRTLPPTAERDVLEFALQLAVGRAMRATAGYGTSETVQTFMRAKSLLNEQASVNDQLLANYFTLTAVLIQGDISTASELAQQCLLLANEQPNSIAQAVAFRLSGETLAMRGKLPQAAEYFQKSLEICEESSEIDFSEVFQHDPLSGVLTLYSITLFLLGHIDRAEAMSTRSMKRAFTTGHTLSIGTILTMRAIFSFEVGNLDQASLDAQAALQYCSEHQLQQYVCWSQIYRGLTLAKSGVLNEGIELVSKAMEQAKTAGAGLLRPLHLTHLAAAYGTSASTSGLPSHIDAGLRCVEEAIQISELTGEHISEPDSHRVRGELLVQLGAISNAEAAFDRALVIAEAQHSRIGELRAATSLAQLWGSQGRRKDAQELLSRTCSSFPAATKVPDFTNAQRLISELADTVV